MMASSIESTHRLNESRNVSIMRRTDNETSKQSAKMVRMEIATNFPVYSQVIETQKFDKMMRNITTQICYRPLILCEKALMTFKNILSVEEVTVFVDRQVLLQKIKHKFDNDFKGSNPRSRASYIVEISMIKNKFYFLALEQKQPGTFDNRMTYED